MHSPRPSLVSLSRRRKNALYSRGKAEKGDALINDLGVRSLFIRPGTSLTSKHFQFRLRQRKELWRNSELLTESLASRKLRVRARPETNVPVCVSNKHYYRSR